MLPGRIPSSQLAEFAARGQTQHHALGVSDLRRLRESPGIQPGIEAGLQAGPEGGRTGLGIEVRFGQGPEGFPQVGLRISGGLQLQCQRCLGPVAWPVDLDVTLTVLSRDAQASELSDPFDSVVLDEGELDLLAVIEDELLAILPLAPMHRDEEQCRAAASGSGAMENGSPDRQRPFVDLAALLSRRRDRVD